MAPVLSRKQKIGLSLILAIGTGKIKKRNRKTWMKNYLLMREHPRSFNILNVLQTEDYSNYLRMDSDSFATLLNLVTPYIQRQNTILRNSVSAKHRLMATLRFLATGDSYQDLKFSVLISQPSLSKIIPETCRAIYACLKDYIKLPQTESEWKKIADQFQRKWNFSHCIGACDGKHVAIEKPPGSGSLFYNYKGFYSIVLFAVVNANYEFLYAQTGTNGATNDGSVLKSSKFYEKLTNGSLNLPAPSPLPGTRQRVPYVLVGDSAFSLNRNLMKPFPMQNISRERRIFNYRLSRARRVVENAFGIMASRFRILQRRLNLDLDNVDVVVLACCALHNFLRKRLPDDDWSSPENSVTVEDDFYREELTNQRDLEEGNSIRNIFMNYFNTVGRVSFQDKIIDNIPK